MENPRAIEKLEIRVVGGEYLVHDEVNGKVHVLNESAAKILQLCDGTHSGEEIARLISDEMHADLQQVTGDVDNIIRQFTELGLVR